MNWIWCNGQWLEGDALEVSSRDRGLLHGLGLFETVLALDGMPVFLDRHLERLLGAAKRLGWSLQVNGLETAMRELLKRNGWDQGRARIRLAVTAGAGSLHDLSQGDDALMWMQASAVGDSSTELRVMVSSWKRNECSPLAGMKCASYAENLLALQEAKDKGFDEVLFLNGAGHLCEGATSNVFLVRGAELLTPDLNSGCLPGITRAVLIEIAKEMGVSIKIDALTQADLDQADELIMTSSTKGVMSVKRLGDRVLQVGSLAGQLREHWENRITKGVIRKSR